MATKTIDANMLAKMFLAGAQNIEAKKEFINELNVFPVPDGDTGTNMTLTILSAAKEVTALADVDMKNLAKAISSGSLRGARGNSGVILSQLLRGFTKSIRDEKEIDTAALAAACQRARDTAYKAVMKPKEGTILTVASGIADKAAELALETEDLEEFIPAVIEHADEVLQKTPEMLPVLLYDGMVEQRRVNWNEVPDTRVTGEYDVTGNVEGVPFAAHAKICVVEELPEAENLLLDVGWEDGLARWNVEKSEDAVAVQLFPEFVDPFPAPPVNAVRVEAPKNFTFSICQTVKVQEAGTYTLSVAFQGTDTTNVDVRLFLNTEEGKEETVIHPTEHAWTGYKVTCEIRKPQEVTAGIRISSPPMYGMMRNFCLQTVKREGQ